MRASTRLSHSKAPSVGCDPIQKLPATLQCPCALRLRSLKNQIFRSLLWSLGSTVYMLSWWLLRPSAVHDCTRDCIVCAGLFLDCPGWSTVTQGIVRKLVNSVKVILVWRNDLSWLLCDILDIVLFLNGENRSAGAVKSWDSCESERRK